MLYLEICAIIFSALVLIAKSIVFFAELIVIINYCSEVPGRRYPYQLEFGGCVATWFRCFFKASPYWALV
jgi:hypothetical protein